MKSRATQTKELDMVNGPLARKILIYSIPLMFSNLLQVFFNMTDVAVVGKFAGARALGYKPRQRLSNKELDGLRQLAACRTDMVNFANALHGLADNEKLRLFRQQPKMLDWYEKVAHVTNHVADFLQSAQTANSYPAGTTNQGTKEDSA